MITHKEFIELVRGYVKYYPKSEDQCKQLQTFAFLDKEDQVLDSNLGQNILDRDNNYFCRAWAEAGHNPNNIIVRYPLLAMMLDDIEGSEYMSQKSSKLAYRYRVFVLGMHQNQKPTLSSSYCEKQHAPDVIDQSAKFFNYLFDYMSGVIYAQDNTGSWSWKHKGLFDYMVSNGDILSYTEDTIKTTRFQKAFKRLNNTDQGKGLNIWWAAEAYGVQGYINVEYSTNEFCDNTLSFDFSQQYGKNLTSFGNQNAKLI
jgi:hypothetical protein